MEEHVTCDDGQTRCTWRVDDPVVRAYHDREFGRPSADETWIFEKLCLETLASGLSFHMVLGKRDILRDAFGGFDLDRVARFTNASITRLMRTPGVIHNEAKLRACVNNARLAREMRDDGGLQAFLWSYEPAPSERPARVTAAWLQRHPTNASSAAMAKAMKTRGFKWVGPTVCYGIFQGLGLVNDHVEGCDFREPCLRDRAAFQPPS